MMDQYFSCYFVNMALLIIYFKFYLKTKNIFVFVIEKIRHFSFALYIRRLRNNSSPNQRFSCLGGRR